MEIMSRAIFDVVAEKRTAGSLQQHKCCFGFTFNVGRIMNILIIDGKSFLCLSITVHIFTLEGRFHFHLLKFLSFNLSLTCISRLFTQAEQCMSSNKRVN